MAYFLTTAALTLGTILFIVSLWIMDSRSPQRVMRKQLAKIDQSLKRLENHVVGNDE